MTTEIKRKHPLAKCEECPLASARCVQSQNPTGAKIALVSRSPGYNDVMAGIPFGGPSGAVLDNLLGRYGISRNNIITTNVVLCETEKPSPKAIAACRPRLLAEIDKVDTVIAAGTEAIGALTKYQTAISARGFVHSRLNSEGTSQRVIATNNPALVLRDSDKFPDLISDFRLAFDPYPVPEFPTVEIIDEPDLAIHRINEWKLSRLEVFASDLEWHIKRIECAGFATSGGEATVFGSGAVGDIRVRELLSKFYGDSNRRFVWHNGKSDTKILRQNGIPGRVDEDTILLSKTLDEVPGSHDLAYLLQTNFGWPDYETPDVKHFKKTGEFKNGEKSRSELYNYNGWDAAGTFQLFEKLRAKVIEQGLLEKPYYQTYIPANEALTQVEMQGFLFDAEEACNINEREVYPRLAGLTTDIRDITGHALLNPGSNQQMAVVYYDEFGLKHGLRDTHARKFSRSTAKEVRKEIDEGRATCNPKFKDELSKVSVLHGRFNKIDKQRGTYIEGLVIRTEEESSRLYCEFNFPGTVTGRAASKNPNFQNITREGVDGIPGIRTIFLPSPGNVILQADYSQAELRTCAVLSGDSNLLSIYRDSSRSLHKERAAAFYGENYTYEQYVFSKNINFGVTYGQSPASFAQMYAKPIEEAEQYVASWWREFPRLKVWTDELWQEARKKSYAQSPFGAKRRIHLITKENFNGLKREIVNFMPQNIAALLTIHALIELVSLGITVISTVHDSIVCDVPVGLVEETSATIKRVMEKKAKELLGWDLPFLCDVSVGETWGSVREIEVAA